MDFVKKSENYKEDEKYFRKLRRNILLKDIFIFLVVVHLKISHSEKTTQHE